MKPGKLRKLEVEILIIFLFLISLTSTVIITYTYERNYNSIMQFSRGTIERISVLIVQKIDCLFSDLEILPQLTIGLVRRHTDVSISNDALSAHMLDEVKYQRNLFGFQAAAPNGNYLAALNLLVTGKPLYAKALPDNAVYMLAFIDRTGGNYKETWYYYDSEQQLISSEEILDRNFDPRKRHWYNQAIKNQGPYWSDVMEFAITGKPGVNVSVPVFSKTKELLAVIGTNLSLENFSAFLSGQKIGLTGQAYILDESGKIIVPMGNTDHRQIVPLAYAKHLREDKTDLILKQDGKKYLASITTFPTTFGQNWQIAIIVPFLDFFGRVVQTQRHLVLISVAILFLTSLLAIYFSKRISRPIVTLAEEVNKIKQLNLDSTVRVNSHINEISLLDSSIAAMRSTIRSFSRYVPKEIVKKLVEMGQEIELGGEKREITLLFSDITGFTSFAEGMPLDALNAFLTEYFDGMSKTVLRNLGTIDKYIGDGMMAFWDAPDFLPDHAAKGCITALECQAFVAEFNARQKKNGLAELKTRIGLNTGEVIVGNVGTKERMNYTVIGDVVNGTERIQEMNKVFHTSIVIGEEVVKRIGDRFVTRPLDIAELKGKKGKIQIYELIATKEGVKPEEGELAESFTAAYQAFHTGKSEARALFEEILRKFPNDYPTQLYLQRLKAR